MEEPHNHLHSTEHTEHKEDYNFKAAYYHILADALTSILAIFALITSKYFNIIHLDPLIGMFGGILILRWSFGLIKQTVRKLVDMK
jgi:Co/Zn/Cd efflux system component